jgi:hypothetical protein
VPPVASLIAYVLSATLAVLGLVFVVGAQGLVARMVVGVILILAAAALAALPRLRPQQLEVRQTLDLPGNVTMKDMPCRKCGSALTKDEIAIKNGTAYVDCSHCGTTYELEEAPKW